MCNASTVFGGTRPKVALDPADPSLGRVADWQPAATSPDSVSPAIPSCSHNSATLVPGLYRDPDLLSALTTTCSQVTLSAGVYFLVFPSSATPWSISKTVTGACDGTGQGVQLVFADQSKLNLTGTLSIPCGRSATASGPKIALYGLRSALGGGGSATTVLRPSTATDTGSSHYFSSSTLVHGDTGGQFGVSAGHARDERAGHCRVEQEDRGAHPERVRRVVGSGLVPGAEHLVDRRPRRGRRDVEDVVLARTSVAVGWVQRRPLAVGE